MKIGTLSPADLQRGFVVCDCGKYAWVFRAAVLVKLPDNSGEFCQECRAYLVPVAKLTAAGVEVKEEAKE